MSSSMASSVPPIFAASHAHEGQDGDRASPPVKPKNPDHTNKSPRRPEDTSPSGDAINGTGEDNQDGKQK
ncbi:hypothetical protein [Dyella sp.]|uniref:hypothetical protein n=1 Tax=Dyella sp. TaxID=1869338 RepID=UPI002ED5AFC9